jgi:uncharacterized protein (TIGR03067 family)
MTDLDRLQGTWNVTTLEMGGSEMPVPGDACIVVAGSRFQSLGMGAVYEGTVELSPRKKPKHIDLFFTAGPENGNRSLGIYELDGDDWKLCLTVTGSTRPTKFATAPGSGHALETLRRGSAPQTEPAAELKGDPAPELEGEWQMLECVADGRTVPDSMVKTGRRVARNQESSTYFGDHRVMQARYAVNKSSVPKTVDYVLSNGKLQYGIWRFEGENLQICFAVPGKPRPQDFNASKGSGNTYTAWKRLGAPVDPLLDSWTDC